MLLKKTQLISISVIFVMLVGLIALPPLMKSSFASAVQAAGGSSTSASTAATSGSQQSTIEQLNTKMAQISSSNKPEDIATLAYIWGFPLVTMQRQFNFDTSPNLSPGQVKAAIAGPANTISCARSLVNASFTGFVSKV